jgi:hypothetical protein
MGKEKAFETHSYDYAIGIQPDNSETSIVRILHCKPSLVENDVVEAGDVIGSLIRSRYFNFWTDPHFHIEIKDREMFYRSTMSYRLKKNIEDASSIEFKGSDFITETEWIVQKVTPDYMLVTSSTAMEGTIGDIHGHVAQLDSRRLGIVDAGIPHYPHGGIFCNDMISGEIAIGNSVIGSLKHPVSSSSFFVQNKENSVYVGDIKVRGLSTYLYTESQLIRGLPPLKIVPREYEGFSRSFREGDSLHIRFRRLE